MHLVVHNPFLGHEIGERITDPETVNRILASEHAGHVVKIAEPEAPPAPVAQQ